MPDQGLEEPRRQEELSGPDEHEAQSQSNPDAVPPPQEEPEDETAGRNLAPTGMGDIPFGVEMERRYTAGVAQDVEVLLTVSGWEGEAIGPWFFRLQEREGETGAPHVLAQEEVLLDDAAVRFVFRDVTFGPEDYALAVSDEEDGEYSELVYLTTYDPVASQLEWVRFGGSWVSGTPAEIDQDELTVTCELPNDWEDLERCYVVFQVSQGATLVVDGEERTEAFYCDFTDPVTFTVVSQNGESQSDYQVTVTKTDRSIYLNSFNITYPVHHDGRGNWQWETAEVELRDDTDVITLRPRHHLTANQDAFEEYSGAGGWEINARPNKTAIFYLNGERTTLQWEGDRRALLEGPATLRVENAYNPAEYREYTIVVENPITWINESYVGKLYNNAGGEHELVWGDGGLEPMQWVEPDDSQEANLGLDLDWDEIIRKIPDLDLRNDDLDMELRIEYYPQREDWRERAEFRWEYDQHEDELPDHLNIVLHNRDVPPGYMHIFLELHINQGPAADTTMFLVLGGITLGDPDYEPYTELPTVSGLVLDPEFPVTGDERITLQFDLPDTDMDQVRVTLFRRFSLSGGRAELSEIVPLIPMGDRRTAWVEFLGRDIWYYGAFQPGDYEVRVNINPGRWHEGRNDHVVIHEFSVTEGSHEARMTAFSINGEAAAINDSAGEITLSLLDNIDKTTIQPHFSSLPGNTVWVDGVEQVSGVSVQDFTHPVTYTVVSEDGSETHYQVTVDWQVASKEARVESFSIGGQLAQIDHDDLTVTLAMHYDRQIDLGAAVPVFTISEKADSVPDWRSPPAMDFTAPQTIAVTAQDGVTANSYTVSVTMDDGSTDTRLIALWGGFPTVNGVGERRDAEVDGLSAHFDLPYTIADLSAVRLYFEIPEFATADLVSGEVYDLRNPLTLTVSAPSGARSEFVITVEIREEEVYTVSGTMRVMTVVGPVPVTDLSLELLDRYGQAVGSFYVDASGRFSYEVPESQAEETRFLRSDQSFGRLLREDHASFQSAAMVVVRPGQEYNMLFGTMADARDLEIRGQVVNLERQAVPDASILYISEMTRTGSDGYFRMTTDQSWMIHHHTSFNVRAGGYYDNSFSVNLSEGEHFLSLLQYGYVDVGQIVMDPVKIATPLSGYSVRAAQQYIQRGMPVEIVVSYTANIQLPGATLTVTVPDGVELMGATDPAAIVTASRLTLTETLLPGESRTLRLYAYARADYSPGSFTVNAALTVNREDYRLGSATVALTDLTLEVPEQIRIGNDGHSELFTIRGEATADKSYTLDFSITDLSGRPVQTNRALTGLPTTGVGPWYSVTDLYVLNAAQNPGVHAVTARLVAPDGSTVREVTKYTNITPDALQLTAASMYSTQFSVSAPAPVSNSSYVSACVYVDDDYVGRDPLEINTIWQNYSKVTGARYVLTSSSGVYAINAGQYNGRFTGNFRSGSYAGSGDATIHIEFTESDGTQSRFLVARLTLLIDPSGIVYDADTRQPVQGATAVLEVLRDGRWVVWEAEEFGQNNYQTTDAQGRYGWYVLEGEYRVLVFADGYWDYRTDEDSYGVIQVPPPRSDIDVYLRPIHSGVATLSHIAVSGDYRTGFSAGEALDLEGLWVTAHYSDGSSRRVEDYVTTPEEGSRLTTLNKEVIVRYTQDGITRMTSYPITVTATGGGTRSSGGSGGSYFADSAGRVLNTLANPQAPAPSTGPVQSGAARALVAQAVQQAAEAASVSITIDNADLLTLEVVREMLRTAGGVRLRVRGDSRLNNGTVDVRLSVWAEELEADLNLRASTKSEAALRVETLFRHWFANENLAFMSMEARGVLGVRADVAFRLSGALREAEELYLYHYDAQANSYRSLPCRRDENGYLHFETDTGGDYVVSDQPLTKR